MNQDAQRFDAVVGEIERLSLQTTEKAPMQLFIELEKTRGLANNAKVALPAVGIVGALVAFLGFGDRLDNLPPFGTGGGSFLYAAFIGIALFAVAAVVWKQLFEARIRSWTARAERVIQERSNIDRVQ